MTCKIELIPISEGTRITVNENEKLIIGRGSSLGCDDKKISRQHAELLLKKDETLWIKPTHINPVFYRPLHGKTIHLTKDIEQELKDGDQIGLLPTSFFFRISFSTDMNNNKDELSSKRADKESTTDVSSKIKSPDVEPKSSVQNTTVSAEDQNDSESVKSRKLPTWMSTSTSSRTDTSSSSTKRQLSVEDEPSNISDKQISTPTTPPVETKSSAELSVTKSSDDETFDSVSPKKLKSNNKPRTHCQYGATCYRKNPAHRTEQSHPGDSDYEDEKETKDNNTTDNTDDDKPLCPYGKTCYRQNPQHKRDYKH